MKLPKQLAQAEKDVELLQKQMAGIEPAPKKPEEPPANPEPPKKEEPPVQPTPPKKEDVKKPEEPAPEPPPAQPVVDDRENTVDYWKQKWRTLDGMYKAELSRNVDHATSTYKQELQSKDQVIQTLINRVGELEKIIGGATPQEPAKQPEPQQPVATPEPEITFPDTQEIKPLNSQEIEDELGEEAGELASTVNTVIGENQKLMKHIKQQAEHMKAQQEQIQDLSTKLGGVGQSVDHLAQTTQQSQHDEFYQRLDEYVPQWEAYNGNAEFNQWLNMPADTHELLPGDVFGSKRRDLLNKAANQKNAKRVAQFFNEGIKAVTTPVQEPAEETVVAPPADTTTTTPPAQQPATEQDTDLLEAQVMPDQSGGGVGDITVDQMAEDLGELQAKMSKASEKLAQTRPNSPLFDKYQKEYDKIADAFQMGFAKWNSSRQT